MRDIPSEIIAVLVVVATLFAVAADAGCVRARPSPGTLSTTSGTIQTDPDGKGSSYSYNNNENCQWTVQCPSGYIGIRYTYEGRTYSSADYMLVRNGDTGATLSNIYGSSSSTAKMVKVTKLTVKWYTSASYTSYGLTFTYQCLTQMCSSANTSKVTYPQTEGRIISDSDGYSYNNYYSNNEDCSWVIQCPKDSDKLAIAAQVRTYSSGDLLSLKRVNDSVAVREMYGSVGTSNSIFPYSSLQVFFKTDSYNTRNGFTIDWRCISSSCSSIVPADSMTLTNNGTIKSDIDGSGSFKYYNSENCAWTVMCDQPGQVVRFTKLSGNTYSSLDSLLVKYPKTSNSSSSLSTLLRAYSTINSPMFTPYSLLYVFFTSRPPPSVRTQYSTTTGSGFTIDFVCGIGQCSSMNTTGSSYTQNDGVLIGRGADSSTYFGNENCSWAIQCATSGSSIFIDITGRTYNGNDKLTIYDQYNFPVRTASGSLNDHFIMRGEDKFVARFTTDVSNSNGFFTLRWSCKPRPCSSSSVGSMADGHGVIKSDGDGSGSQDYYQNEQCEWDIVCPAGSNYIMVRMSGYTYGSTDKVEFVKLDGELISSYYGSLNVAKFFTGAALGIKFEPKGSSLSGTHNGFTITFTCSPSKCSSVNATSTTYTQATGFIKSDADGSSSSTYYMNDENCLWKVRCPSGTSYARILLDGRTYSSSDPVKVKYTTGSTYLSQYGSFSKSLYVMTTTTGFDLSFTSSSSGTQRGFTVWWTCQPTYCSSANMSGVTFNNLASGVLLSDADGQSSSTYYKNSERCEWTVNCPTGTKFSMVGLKGRTYNSADYVRLLTTSGSTIASYYGSLGRNKFTSYQSVKIKFYSSSSSYSYGFTLWWTCGTDKCSSRTPTGDLTATSGTLMSDIDGYSSSTYYMNDENCVWNIKCPDPSSQLLLRFRGRTYSSSDYLRIDYGSTYTQRYGSFTSWNTIVSPTSTAKVKFYTSSSGTSYGFTLNWACLSATSTSCKSPNTTYSLIGSTAKYNKILSDKDGSASSHYYSPDQYCVWQIRCANSSHILAFSITGYVESNDDFVFLLFGADEYGTSATYKLLTSTLSYSSGLAGANNATLMFMADSNSNYQGWTASYKCLTSTCSATGPETGTVLTTKTGTIKSDTDGYGSNNVLNGERCSWSIQCPSTSSSILVNILKSLPGYDKVRLVTSTSQTDYYGSSTVNVFLGQRTAQVLFASTSSSYNGFTLSYTCGTSQCSSASSGTTFTAFNGQIKSDSDGSGYIDYYNGENCKWKIRCPADNSINLHIVGITVTSDYLRFTDVNKSVVLSPTSGLMYTSDILSTNEVDIAFQSSASGYTNNGFTINYTCIRKIVFTVPPQLAGNGTALTPEQRHKLCPSSNSTPFAEQTFGSFGFNKLSYSSTEEVCGWSLVCPSGYNRMMAVLRGNAGVEDTVIVLDGNGNRKLLALAGAFGRTEILETNSVMVAFVTKFPSEIFGRYLCLPTALSSSALAYRLATSSSSNYVKSDSDGSSSSSRYGTNINSLDVVSCPGSNLRITRIDGRTSGSSDQVYVYDGETGALIGGYYGSFYRTMSYVTSVALIHFKTDSYSSSYNYGWTFTYSCTTQSSYNALQSGKSSDDSSSAAKTAGIAAGVSIALLLIIVIIVIIVTRSVVSRRARRTADDDGHDERMADRHTRRTARHDTSSSPQQQVPSNALFPPMPSYTSSSHQTGMGGFGASAYDSMAVPTPPGYGHDQAQANPPPDVPAGFFLARQDKVMGAAEDPTQTLCCICLAHRPTFSMVPCGHLVLCEGCHARFEPTNCPVCRLACSSAMRVYFIKGHGHGDKATGQASVCMSCNDAQAKFAPVPCGHVCLCDRCRPMQCPACSQYSGQIIEIFK